MYWSGPPAAMMPPAGQQQEHMQPHHRPPMLDPAMMQYWMQVLPTSMCLLGGVGLSAASVPGTASLTKHALTLYCRLAQYVPLACLLSVHV